MGTVDRQRNPAIVWFRADLRLDDNPAWAAATAAHDQVVALFVLDPLLIERAGPLRRDQLFAHLGALDERLREAGGRLVSRAGPAEQVVPEVVGECAAVAVHVNAHGTPYAQRRDRAVAAALDAPLVTSHGCTVHAPGTVVTKSGALAQVFAAFYRQWLVTPAQPWPEARPTDVLSLPGDRIPRPAGPPRHEPGEAAAWSRLTSWLERVDGYADQRDLLAADGTSGLSADLKFGTLAARRVAEVVGQASAGRESFVRQLAWRDWWAHLLAARPGMVEHAVSPRFDSVRWRDDPTGFQRWCEGATGFPVVDAGMRQLVATGWVHNRARMICASFLVKDLLVDWRLGERFFRHHLVDADVAQNVGNWQWVAGTGPDAAPYFRVFNPTAQASRYDPGGAYIRRWVPELAGLPAPAIHEPAAAPPLELAAAGVVLGDTYPFPIVDHAAARVRAVAAYKAAR